MGFVLSAKPVREAVAGRNHFEHGRIYASEVSVNQIMLRSFRPLKSSYYKRATRFFRLSQRAFLRHFDSASRRMEWLVPIFRRASHRLLCSSQHLVDWWVRSEAGLWLLRASRTMMESLYEASADVGEWFIRHPLVNSRSKRSGLVPARLLRAASELTRKLLASERVQAFAARWQPAKRRLYAALRYERLSTLAQQFVQNGILPAGCWIRSQMRYAQTRLSESARRTWFSCMAWLGKSEAS